MMPLDHRDAKRMSRSDKLAVIAAAEAIAQSGVALDRAIVSTPRFVAMKKYCLDLLHMTEAGVQSEEAA